MIEVATADFDQTRAGLELLLADLPRPERDAQIEGMVTGTVAIDLSGLLIATRQNTVVGAILSLMQPDGCGFFWPPRTAKDAVKDEVVNALLDHLKRRHDEVGAWISQCILDPQDTEDRSALERNGFEHLANLMYLHRDLHDPIPESRSQLTVTTADPDENPQRYAEIIEATYEQTQDCPGLNGLRTGLEAVAGHKSTGGYLPNDWYIFRDADHDVGVLILADQPEQDAWEVVYMGIVPQARGRGYGREVVIQALNAAGGSSRGGLLLAVDGNNSPAIRVYESLGFRLFVEKSVYVRRGPGRLQS